MYFHALLLLISFNLFAKEFPVRQNTRLTYLPNQKIDFSMRIKAIQEAKKSIDIISFSQALDSIGAPFIYQLRQKLQKDCIKIRFIYDSFASLVDLDFFNHSAKALTSSDLKCKAEVITLNIFDKINRDLEIDDFIHQKALIIDHGTQFEKIFIGGRGYTHFSNIVLDSALLIEPINPAEASLASDIKVSFDQLWSIAGKVSTPYATTDEFEFTDEKTLPFPLEEAELKSYIPKSIQLFSNDLFFQLLKADPPLKRREDISNANISELVNTINQFNGSISIYSYAIAFPKTLKNAFVTFLKRGNTLNLFTNSRESHRIFFPLGVPIYYSLETIMDIFRMKSEGKLNVYFLNPLSANSIKKDKYLLQKLILFNNPDQKIIYTGSDNFTWSSTYKNDEWLVKIQDENLFNDIEQINSSTRKIYDYFPQKDLEELNQDKNFIYQIFRPFIENNY